LHQAPLFTSLDRRALGGGCYDPTRPWQENLSRVHLPVSERLSRQLVSFPRLDEAPREFVRLCGRTLRKVTMTLVPQSFAAQLSLSAEGGHLADQFRPF